MRKKQRHTVRKIGLLLVFILAVFLLILERSRFLKLYERQVREKTEEWITLGWLIEEIPPFQRKSEMPGRFDGLYTYLFPALSFSLCFDEDDFTNPEDELVKDQMVYENQTVSRLHKGQSQGRKGIFWNWREYVSETEVEAVITENMEEELVMPVSGKTEYREKSVVYQASDFQNAADMLNYFYTVDPSTTVQESQINIAEMLAKDMSLDFEKDGPQILIYHTHSQEAFADSLTGDTSTGIVGAGEYLKDLLERYGFRVLHETGEYDVESRSTAYSNIQPVLENYLEMYPDIQVMIDLHRDEVKEGKLVTEIDGKQTAKFMFFNGLSYLNGVGDISYLSNPNKEDNMAFAFQLQYLANQYFPGITRKIYVKGYRYNLHYRPKSLLIELGAQTNTFEEILNACEPLAEVIARVLYGEK